MLRLLSSSLAWLTVHRPKQKLAIPRDWGLMRSFPQQRCPDLLSLRNLTLLLFSLSKSMCGLIRWLFLSFGLTFKAEQLSDLGLCCLLFRNLWLQGCIYAQGPLYTFSKSSHELAFNPSWMNYAALAKSSTVPSEQSVNRVMMHQDVVLNHFVAQNDLNIGLLFSLKRWKKN